MAKITVTMDQLTLLKNSGLIDAEGWGIGRGVIKDMSMTINWEMTCKQLTEAFKEGGLLDMEVMGIDNEKNTFLWEEDGEFGVNSFHLVVGENGKLHADCGGVPLMTWKAD